MFNDWIYNPGKISVLSPVNVSKYEFLTSKDVLPEKDLLEKSVELKRFEYSPLGKEIKAQSDIANKQYQKLDDADEFDETINKKSTLKKHSKWDLIYEIIIVFSNIIVIIKNLLQTRFLSNQSTGFYLNF